MRNPQHTWEEVGQDIREKMKVRAVEDDKEMNKRMEALQAQWARESFKLVRGTSDQRK